MSKSVNTRFDFYYLLLFIWCFHKFSAVEALVTFQRIVALVVGLVWRGKNCWIVFSADRRAITVVICAFCYGRTGLSVLFIWKWKYLRVFYQILLIILKPLENLRPPQSFDTVWYTFVPYFTFILFQLLCFYTRKLERLGVQYLLEHVNIMHVWVELLFGPVGIGLRWSFYLNKGYFW